MSANTFARDLFFAVHEDLPRQAPGCEAATLQALRMTGLSGAIDVLDVGCGPGLHTLHLAAALPEACLTGTDVYAPYLAELEKRAAAASFTHRIRTRLADMKDLPFEPGSFDLIWCEAAVYIMGFECALRTWAPLLRPDGCLAVSDLVWLREERPPEAVRFWRTYPDMATIETRRRTVATCGYALLGDFVLPASAWLDEYYRPMQANIHQLRQLHAGNPQAEAVLAASEHEIRVFESSGNSYGYVFFVMRARAG
jgi:SAM-dependent methyltransferase